MFSLSQSMAFTNWGMTPVKAIDWLKENMVPYYPLGVIKETGGAAK
jgi:2-oxoglutarate ferredoxin oxidoreductase subunit beta